MSKLSELTTAQIEAMPAGEEMDWWVLSLHDDWSQWEAQPSERADEAFRALKEWCDANDVDVQLYIVGGCTMCRILPLRGEQMMVSSDEQETSLAICRALLLAAKALETQQ